MVYRVNEKSGQYLEAEDNLLRHADEFRKQIPDDEYISNLGLFITPQERRREFFLFEVYKRLSGVRGCVAQFGVRWGRELALFESLRTIFEPFNHSRHIFGFDTFEGYASVGVEDGSSRQISNGNLDVFDGYENYLEDLLLVREQLSPIPQKQKFTLIKGNVEETFPKFLDEYSWTQFGLIHLDLNLYRPTKVVLERILERCTPNALLILDEYGCETLPGETIAIRDYLNNGKLEPEEFGFESPTWPLVTRVKF